jgi:hypothetical protein
MVTNELFPELRLCANLILVLNGVVLFVLFLFTNFFVFVNIYIYFVASLLSMCVCFFVSCVYNGANSNNVALFVLYY